MRKNKYLSFAAILMVFIALFTAIALAGGIRTLICLDKRYQRVDAGYVYISLQHESNPLKLPDEERTLSSFEDVYSSLQNSELYTYYEMYCQPLDISRGSGAYFDESGERLSEDSERPPCIQISRNVQHDYGLTVLRGRLLSAEDYDHQRGEAIPVLMGYDYSEVYGIGDKFTADYLFSTYSFEVVGFLNDNCKLTMSTGTVDLDRYIIMPSFQFGYLPQTEQEYVSQKIHHANRTSGKIRVAQDDYSQACDFLQSAIASSAVGNYSWTSSSLAKNMARIGVDIYTAYPVLLALSAALAPVALVLTGQYYGVHAKNTSRVSPLVTLKRAGSFAGVLFTAIVLSLMLSSVCLGYLGLARYSLWGVYASIPIALIGLLTIIGNAHRER